jgi:hypothetical protein
MDIVSEMNLNPCCNPYINYFKISSLFKKKVLNMVLDDFIFRCLLLLIILLILKQELRLALYL